MGARGEALLRPRRGVIEGGRREWARLYDSDVFFKIVNYEAVVRDKHLLADRDFDLVVLGTRRSGSRTGRPRPPRS
jgi:hypothetical protein